jgi:hypothetical protein
LSIQSQDFTTWTGGANVTADQDVSPDGTTNADELNGQIFRTIAASAVQYTFSVFAKAKATNDTLELRFDNTITLRRAFFNLTTGTVTSSSNATAVSENYGNGWYRCSIVVTATATTFYQVINRSSATSFYIWGAQLEAGAFATSYIPTTTTALTRNADVATMTGTNFSDWYNATEGTFTIRNSYSPTSSGNNGSRVSLRVSDGTVSNQMTLYNRNGTANAAVGLTGGVAQFVNDGIAATGATIQSVFTYKVNSINLYTSGNSIFTDTVATIPTVNKLSIGDNLNGYIEKLAFYNVVMLPSEGISFSK